jgi:hypothetical protein
MVRSLACALALLCGASRCAVAADATPVPASPAASAQPLPAVTVLGNYLNAVGTSDAASQGAVTATLIAARPTLRPAEVLEFVPGLIVSQHSGDGKANQYYLRGFNLDHGTDFATFVAGMPVNMVSHAHGQGYSDLNWLIPELVDRIAYRKGPYFADEGDFSSAGAAHIQLFDTLPRGLASLTVGENGYDRALLAQSIANNATNELVLNTGTFQHPSALVANLQSTSGTTISATATGVQIGIGLGGGTIDASSSNSSLSVTGNRIGATAIGNNAVNRVTAQ